MKIDDLRVLTKRIEDGEWTDAPGLPGVRLKVRGLMSRAYRTRYAEVVTRLNRAQRADPAQAEKAANEAIVDALLLDWEGITDGEEPTLYSKELAARLIGDPDVRVFRNAVILAAEDIG